MNVRIFADGADLEGIERLAEDPRIEGFTTNPTLMRQAGVDDYEKFSRAMLEIVGERPVSFEVFTDDVDEMVVQARKISGWGDSVFVKIPITNTKGESTATAVKELCAAGVKVNVTALLTVSQVEHVSGSLEPEVPAFVSVFAGRIADTGRDPVPLMVESLRVLEAVPSAELIWASPRELLNLVQADEIGCHIITVTHDLLKKLPTIGKDLTQFSLETVQMFHDDARVAGYSI